MAEMIIKIAGIIGAVGVIAGVLWKVHLILVKVEKIVEKLDEHSKSIEEFKTYGDAIKKLQEHSLENYRQILRLVIVSPEMPLSERVAAAETYCSDEIGGNGGVKTFYKNKLAPKWAEEQEKRSEK